MNILLIIRKSELKFKHIVTSVYSYFTLVYLIKAYRISIGSNFKSNGVPIIKMNGSNSKFIIGDGFRMNNGISFNQIGRQQRCFFILSENSKLEIGNNVGISSTSIICTKSIIIGNNVKIGGNVAIYDTDFHSLNYQNRRDFKLDISSKISKDIKIGNDVFIGAHSTILKGVSIGDRSIIGACSVVTKNVPENEIWAGNPAVYIKKIPL